MRGPRAIRGLSRALILAWGLLWALPGLAQQSEELPVSKGRTRKLRVKAEFKVNVRHSRETSWRLATPVPPEFLRPGEDALWLRTPDPGTSFELSNLALEAEYSFTPQIVAKGRVHVLDLYSRNPSSSDDRIFVREAWLRIGDKYDSLRPMPGTSGYVLVGLAPRFTRQRVRALESYGLWGTSVSRFEQLQLQGGGSIGSKLYWRAHLANRNPLFMRDPNALAGDNGTEERVPGNNDPAYGSGFPLLYDTLASDVSPDEGLEWGAGLGFRLLADETNDGIDVLGWVFGGNLAEEADIRSSFYQGDLELLAAPGGPLPFEGDDKLEYGVNIEGRFDGLRWFAQYVRQNIAELERDGFEAEVSYRVPLRGWLVSGDRPVFNWLRFAFRFSNIDNDFSAPSVFVAPSFAWDWRKYDFGVRLGIIRNIDLTAEYARHDLLTASGTLHPDEALLSLRVAF